MPDPARESAAGQFLAGLRVLEIGDGIAGAAATAVLHSYGAEITTVVSGDAASHRLEPSVEIGADRDSLLSLLQRTGKEVVGDLPTTSGFDVVLVDRIDGGPAGFSGDATGYLADVATRNANVWISISAFGLSGPRRDFRGTDFVLAAAGGLLGAVTHPDTGRPVKLPGVQSLLAAGHLAALAACHGLDEVRRTGRPVHVDLSGQEAVLLSGPVLGLAQALMDVTAIGGVRRVAPSGFIRCRDGLVRVVCSESHQWAGLVRAIGEPAWAVEYPTNAERVPHAAEIDRLLDAAFADVTKADCERRLQEAGVPATVMCGPAELLAHRQFRARGAIGSYEVGGLAPAGVRTALQMTSAPAREGREPAPGITGLRIAEFGHVLAVPLAASLLGAMGAAVTKYEDTTRHDTYRRNGPFVDDVPGIDRGAYFAVANHSKRSRALAMSSDAATIAAALEESDVVVENFGPARAGRMGIDAATVLSGHPDKLAISVSGFGHTGPAAAYRSYAYNLHSACGLLHLLNDQNGALTEVDLAWADLVSTFAIATAIAAWAVGPGGHPGTAIDLSMAEHGAQRFNEFLAAESLRPGAGRPEPGGQEQAPFAPQGTYPSADGRLVAVSISSISEWVRLAEELGTPLLETVDEAAAALAASAAGTDSTSFVERLQGVGIAAAEVLGPADLVRDPHLAARAFFAEVTHPQWGTRRLLGLPWRFVGSAPARLGAPPELGDADINLIGGRSR